MARIRVRILRQGVLFVGLASAMLCAQLIDHLNVVVWRPRSRPIAHLIIVIVFLIRLEASLVQCQDSLLFHLSELALHRDVISTDSILIIASSVKETSIWHTIILRDLATGRLLLVREGLLMILLVDRRV